MKKSLGSNNNLKSSSLGKKHQIKDKLQANLIKRKKKKHLKII